jgi:hypothetical protein
VKVGDGEQCLEAPGEPARLVEGLALGAVRLRQEL